MFTPRFIMRYGADLDGQSIINVSDPVNAQDAVTLRWASDATHLTDGNIDPRLLPNLTGDITSLLENGRIVTTLSPSGVIPNNYTKITVDQSGRITSGTNLNADDIPSLGHLYQPLDANLTSIARLSSIPGFLKTNGQGQWSIDSITGYLTENQPINLSGDIVGTGSTQISAHLSYTGVIAGTYESVTVDAKGRVTAGANPTNSSGSVSLDYSMVLTDNVEYKLLGVDISEYGSIKTIIQSSHNSHRQIQEVLATHNGIDAYCTEYGSISTDEPLIHTDVDILDGRLRLLVTPFNAGTTVVKAIVFLVKL